MGDQLSLTTSSSIGSFSYGEYTDDDMLSLMSSSGPTSSTSVEEEGAESLERPNIEGASLVEVVGVPARFRPGITVDNNNNNNNNISLFQYLPPPSSPEYYKTVLAMAVGLLYLDFTQDDTLRNARSKARYTPTRDHLVLECRRRHDDLLRRLSGQHHHHHQTQQQQQAVDFGRWNQEDLIQWSHQHPIENPTEMEFLRSEVQCLKNVIE